MAVETIRLKHHPKEYLGDFKDDPEGVVFEQKLIELQARSVIPRIEVYSDKGRTEPTLHKVFFKRTPITSLKDCDFGDATREDQLWRT